ncbi:MAG: hypothetical protein ACE5HD_05850 [Acidobacteriota bacterium]
MKYYCAIFFPLLLVATGPAAGAAASIHSHPSTAREPAGSIDFAVRPLSRLGRGQSTRVLMEVTLFSQKDLSALRLTGRDRSLGGGEKVLDVPDSVRSLRARAARKIQFQVDLQNGQEHHLSFTLYSTDSSGVFHESSAYVRVDLDPRRQPETPKGLLQFHARMEGN